MNEKEKRDARVSTAIAGLIAGAMMQDVSVSVVAGAMAFIVLAYLGVDTAISVAGAVAVGGGIMYIYGNSAMRTGIKTIKLLSEQDKNSGGAK